MESIDYTRMVRLTGNIDAESASMVCEKITKLFLESPKKPITLIISSPGGHVPSTVAAYEYLKKIIKPNLITIALGEVDSMAPILFLAGKRRIVGKYTEMFFHKIGKSYKDRRLDINDLEQAIVDLKTSESVYYEIFKTVANIENTVVAGWMKEEKTISAQEMVRLGIATEILEDPI